MAIQKAVIGMQCFWGAESSFAKIRTRVGYAGGSTPNPTYRNIGDHSEVVEIQFEPSEVSYNDILAWFWKKHDPVVRHKKQYQSAILYVDEEQKKIAQTTYKEQECKFGVGKLSTYIAPLDVFYQAEDYHQKYWLRGRGPVMHDFGLHDKSLVDSYLATKLNAYMAGYTDFTELDQFAKELMIPAPLIENVKEYAISGGDPRNCHA